MFDGPPVNPRGNGVQQIKTLLTRWTTYVFQSPIRS